MTFGGFATQVFGHHPNDPTTNVRPAGTLGSRYRVVYSVSTPAGRRSIVADLYPYAIPRAVTYMKPGQPFYRAIVTHGGWYAARPGFKRTLVQAGMHATAPQGGGGTHIWRWVGLAAFGLVALCAVAAVVLLRRRPQSTPAPAS